MFHRNFLGAAPFVAFAIAACNDPTVVRDPATVSTDRGVQTALEAVDKGHRQYGPATKVGDGVVRTYIVTDDTRKVPLEIGVAMSEKALEGLPAPMTDADMQHGHMTAPIYLLDLPQQNPTPYRFVELNWNAMGHDPAGIYDLPHFDFHFYVVDRSVRAGILPTDPQYAQKAGNFPGAEYRPQFFVDVATLAHAPLAAVTVPEMGLHWLDVRSPELQMAGGNPAGYKPFTKTFIYGSWDGQFIFQEPMITRAYILAKRDATDPAVRDEIIPVPTAQKYAPAGYYPSAYRITYDAQAKEYRVALTQLAKYE